MVSWFRSWWKNTSKPLRAAIIILLVILIVLLIGGYFFNWDWTGFGPYTLPNSYSQREKTLWDWLQLFFIPAAIAFGVLWFSHLQQQRDQQLADQRTQTEREAADKQAQTERDIALDNQREAALQTYIDSMSELLLEKKLRESDENAEVRTIARVRTLTVLPRLDGKRKRSVLLFLYDSGLIHKDKKVIDLDRADLRGADLHYAKLHEVDLSRVSLSEADLSHAELTGANLYNAGLGEADLSFTKLSDTTLTGAILVLANLSLASLDRADMRHADLTLVDLTAAILSDADLSFATLIGAKVTTEQLKYVKSLAGAIMPDGTPHD